MIKRSRLGFNLGADQRSLSRQQRSHSPSGLLVVQLPARAAVIDRSAVHVAHVAVGERVPTGVGRRDDPEGDPVEATGQYW